MGWILSFISLGLRIPVPESIPHSTIGLIGELRRGRECRGARRDPAVCVCLFHTGTVWRRCRPRLERTRSSSAHNSYGRSKLAAEADVQASGVPFTILRPVLLYGRGVKGNFATLVRAARSPWPLPVKQFTNRRSFLGTDNFVSALSFVFSRPDTAGEIYVVADPGPAPALCELIATLRKGKGRRPLLLPLPTALVEKPLRLMGRQDLWMRLGGDLRADPAKLIAAGWRPLHDTRSGLMAMVQSRAGGA